jgi:hypothetical protein
MISTATEVLGLSLHWSKQGRVRSYKQCWTPERAGSSPRRPEQYYSQQLPPSNQQAYSGSYHYGERPGHENEHLGENTQSESYFVPTPTPRAYQNSGSH